MHAMNVKSNHVRMQVQLDVGRLNVTHNQHIHSAIIHVIIQQKLLPC